MTTAVVAERGQVTIPKKIQDYLGITPSTVLEFSVKDGAIIATKKIDSNPVDVVLGCLKPGKRSDAILDELRGVP